MNIQIGHPDTEKFLEIEYNLFQIYLKIGTDKPHNHKEILEFIIDDVEATADHIDWHDGDVAIAFRRWIESKSENQP